jgi:hypothetical protein
MKVSPIKNEKQVCHIEGPLWRHMYKCACRRSPCDHVFSAICVDVGTMQSYSSYVGLITLCFKSAIPPGCAPRPHCGAICVDISTTHDVYSICSGPNSVLLEWNSTTLCLVILFTFLSRRDCCSRFSNVPDSVPR